MKVVIVMATQVMTTRAMPAQVTSARLAASDQFSLGLPMSHLRLTSRGRALVAVVLLVAGVAFVGAAADVAAPVAGETMRGQGVVSARGTEVGTGAGAGAFMTHEVAEGDSLWSIAEALAPTADPRPIVFELKRLNGLESAHLRIGQRLLLPSVASN